MTSNDIIGPMSAILDRAVADPAARAAAERDLIAAAARIVDASSPDLWTSRARPTFLYVMYALLLWSIPMGLVAAFRPALATAIVKGMTAYLAALPEPLYALFGTGYLGYTVAREWGKAKTG